MSTIDMKYEKKQCPVDGCQRFAMTRPDKPRVFCIFHECHAIGCFAKIAIGLHCAAHIPLRRLSVEVRG